MSGEWMKIALVTLMILFLAACANSGSTAAIPTAAEEISGEEQDTSANSLDIDAAAIYSDRCARCHGADRSGKNGPALLPEQLTGDPAVYQSTIINGRGSMPGWGSRLSADEINALVEFILLDPQ